MRLNMYNMKNKLCYKARDSLYFTDFITQSTVATTSWWQLFVLIKVIFSQQVWENYFYYYKLHMLSFCLHFCLSPWHVFPCSPQAWLKEKWYPRCSVATGCQSPTTVPKSCTTSWCRAGITNQKTGPPLITCRVFWMIFTQPQKDSTSNSHRERHLQSVKTFQIHTFIQDYKWKHLFCNLYIYVYMSHSLHICII